MSGKHLCLALLHLVSPLLCRFLTADAGDHLLAEQRPEGLRAAGVFVSSTKASVGLGTNFSRNMCHMRKKRKDRETRDAK